MALPIERAHKIASAVVGPDGLHDEDVVGAH